MKTHPYLRAYIAGIVIPTIAVPCGLVLFVIARFIFEDPIPIERVLIFPMALIPTFFGLWNMLYMRLKTGRYLPIGLHGAILPLIFIPLGMTGAVILRFLSIGAKEIVWFDTLHIPYTLFIPWIAVIVAVYYLLWKYLVAFFNRILDLY